MRLRSAIALLPLALGASFGQGSIQTTAGTGTCGFSGDGSPAVSATLCNPQGAAADTAGNIYFVDSANWRIRKISTSGTISTIAGTGVRGTTGDEGFAVLAAIGVVTHLASDSTGVLCFGDLDAHKLRCIFPNGLIHGFGTGVAASSGDGQILSLASYNTPTGMAFVPRYQAPSASADIYVADSTDNVIRKIDAFTNVVSTVVGPGTPGQLGDGGPGTAASLSAPSGLASFNNALYIADSGNHRIRKLDLATGIITTVAGTGTPSFGGDGGPATLAQLSSPGHVVFDSLGYMYVSDRGNMRVRKIDLSGTVTTFAGDGTTGFGPDNVPPTQTRFAGIQGLAWNAPTFGLVIADGSNRVRTASPYTATTITLSMSPVNSAPGDTITLTATVSPAAATGTVTFNYGSGGPFGTATLAGGQAVFSWTPTFVGLTPLKAIYLGDTAYSSSTSPIVNENVQLITTTTYLSVSPSPATQGQPVTMTALVSPAAATGTVQFLNYYTVLGSAPVVNGVATFTTSALAAGSYSLSAKYLGDTRDAVSQSSAVSESIKNATTTTLTTDVNPSSYGSNIAITATVTPAGATGTMQFFNGAALLATVTVTGSVAQLGTASLPVGATSLTGVYSGDANNLGSTSNAVTQTVNVATSTTTLSALPASAAFGQSVTLTAMELPSSTGTVQFFNGAALLGSATISGNQAQLVSTSLLVGTNSLTAVYSGNANVNGSTSAAIVVTISATPSSTSLAASPAAASFGQTVTLTASVTPATATGTVQFMNGATSLGTAVVASGQAVLATTALPVGANSVTAIYSGNATTATSTSSAVAVTISQVATTTTLAASPAPAAFAQAVTLTATVTPSTVTGTVQFFNGATSLGTAALSGGQAQLSTTALPVGTASIKAVYAGDANSATSTSSVVTVSVSAAATTTVLTANPASSTFGQAVTLTATVTPAAATGTVQFLNGATVLGSAAVSAGQAQLSVTSLPVGADSLTAVYSGDTNNATSTSAAVAQTVAQASSTTTLAASPSPSAAGQAVTLTATISPAAATGTVQFFNGATSLGSAAVASGQAQLSTSALPVGANSLTAVYSGDATYLTSTSSAVTQTVSKTSSTTTLTTNTTPSLFTQPIVLRAAVTPAAATGTVQFFNGAASVGSAAVASGLAQLTIDTLPTGSDSLTTVYSGDANTAGSTSAPFVQTVNKTASVTWLSVPALSDIVGQPFAITATVPGNGVSGNVSFYQGSTLLGTQALSNGTATLTWTPLATGTYALSAAYAGNTNYNPSDSSASPINVTVVKAATTTSTPASSLNASNQGQAVTFTATVTPATATGTVTFTGVGSAPVVSGVASIATSALPPGANSVAAQYSGDANYTASTSLPMTQYVRVLTATSVTGTPNPSAFGGSVTLTATVTPATAAGAVQFFDGATLVGTGALSGGHATLSTSALAAGSHAITASYGGDAASAPSASSALTQTVNKANTATTLTASPGSPSRSGQTVTFTARVSPSAATGTVQFLNGSTVMGTVTVSGGTAALATSTLPVGTHSIRAVYSGNPNLNTSQSSSLSYRVR